MELHGYYMNTDMELELKEQTRRYQRRELRPFWLQQVNEKTGSPSQTLEQAERAVGGPCLPVELLREEKLGEFQGPVQVFLVGGESVEKQEHVSAAGHPVTDPRAFLQETLLPGQLAALQAGLQVSGVLPHQIGLGE